MPKGGCGGALVCPDPPIPLSFGHAGTLATLLRNATRRLQEAQVRPRRPRAAQRATGSATAAVTRRAAPRLRKLDGDGAAEGGAAAAAGVEEPVIEALS